MKLLSFDTETYLIQPGRQAPPMVVACFAVLLRLIRKRANGAEVTA